MFRTCYVRIDAHLEKVPRVRAEGHPPFKEALIEDDVFSLIYDLNLQSFRFLAFRIIDEVLPVDNNAMVTQPPRVRRCQASPQCDQAPPASELGWR